MPKVAQSGQILSFYAGVTKVSGHKLFGPDVN